MTTKPLSGIKVLDMTKVLAGPYCGMMLRNLGAEVIHCEMPGSGDDARAYGPYVEGQSIYFLSINRGKKSLEVNAKTPEGKKVLTDLVKNVDVFVQNFKPGALDKMGFGYEDVKKINPRCVYVAISGFGQTGPYSGRPAYDMIVQAMGGVMSITGEPNGNPVRVGTSIGDIIAGMMGAYGALAALYEREKTGEGQLVDISMLDCQVAILENAIAKYSATGQVARPLGLKHPSITPFEAYRTKDSWVIVAAGNNKLFAKFCEVTGRQELINDPKFSTNPERNKHMQELSDLMQERIKDKTTDEWLKIFVDNGIPCGPINSIDRLFEDPQINYRNMLVEVEQTHMGKVKVAGNPVKLSTVPPEDELPSEPAPQVGEHNVEVLRDILGYSEDDIKSYIDTLPKKE